MKSIFVLITIFFALSSWANKDLAVPGEYLVKLTQGYSYKDLPDLGIDYSRSELISDRLNILLISNPKINKKPYPNDDFKSHPAVERIEPNWIFKIVKTPNDPSFSKLWGMRNKGGLFSKKGMDINVEPAWDITTGDKKVVVAVIDTGVNYEHPDLKANMWKNLEEFNGNPHVDDDGNGLVDDIYGANFVNSTGNPMDDHGHGTHCAGTIGAVGNNSIGVVGVNWDVSIMALKFISKDGTGTASSAVKSIVYAVENGAHVLSNSWGGYDVSGALRDAIKLARENNVLFVAASGNDGKDTGAKPMYPASYSLDNVISVAAINKSGRLAYFSNFGDKVHLAAPGEDIYSTVLKGYGKKSGTSMATPHVAGAAALVKAKEWNLNYKSIKDKIIDNVKANSHIKKKVKSGGMLDVHGALVH